MRRRSFLKGAAALPAAGIATTSVVTGMDLAKVPSYTHKSYGVTFSNNFGKALWPGIKEWYGKEYGTEWPIK